jgi:hypothetical protein
VKVTIDAAGRKVEVECADANTSPREVLSEALDTWKATDGAPDSQGPAYGFAAAHAGYQQSPMNGARIREVKA